MQWEVWLFASLHDRHRAVAVWHYVLTFDALVRGHALLLSIGVHGRRQPDSVNVLAAWFVLRLGTHQVGRLWAHALPHHFFRVAAPRPGPPRRFVCYRGHLVLVAVVLFLFV